MRNNDYVAAMYVCDVENLIERLLNTIEGRYEVSFAPTQRKKIKELCEREIDAHVIGVPAERKEIERLKAELARYMELGTPDELAKALASSKDGAYRKLLDVMDENNRIGNRLCVAECKIRDLERTVESRNRTCEKRKEHIAQLKAENGRLLKMMTDYAEEVGRLEMKVEMMERGDAHEGHKQGRNHERPEVQAQGSAGRGQ